VRDVAARELGRVGDAHAESFEPLAVRRTGAQHAACEPRNIRSVSRVSSVPMLWAMIADAAADLIDELIGRLGYGPKQAAE
jgi:hypothetical protein